MKATTGIAGCCARAASGLGRSAAKQRDKLPSLQLIELHPILIVAGP
jgi:hypothetical protein